MQSNDHRIIVLHSNAVVRARVTSLLAMRDEDCAAVARWDDLMARLDEQPSVIAFPITTDLRGRASQLLSDVHDLAPYCLVLCSAPYGDAATARSAFRAGAWDCLEEPVSAAQWCDCILEATQHAMNQDAQSPAKRKKALTDDRVLQWMNRMRRELRSTHRESTQALVAAVEAKDPFTRAHSQTVCAYADVIGKRLCLPTSLRSTIRAAALLHDVGKIGVPDAILTKPGPLCESEFNVIKRHPQTALDILGHVSFLHDERPLILHHHERFDGGGYPAGLLGDRIPIGARVLAVADSIDAMLSPRCYKPSYDVSRVRAELAAGAGRQFDPRIVHVALEWLARKPQGMTACKPLHMN